MSTGHKDGNVSRVWQKVFFGLPELFTTLGLRLGLGSGLRLGFRVRVSLRIRVYS